MFPKVAESKASVIDGTKYVACQAQWSYKLGMEVGCLWVEERVHGREGSGPRCSEAVIGQAALGADVGEYESEER